MTKLNKANYYNRKEKKKVNCYKVNISKELIAKANISEEDEINIYAKDGKIIIEKVSKGE